MKKIMVALFAVALGMGMVSCNGNTKAGNDKDSTATAVEKAAPEEPKVNIADVVAKAKAEGANWSVDEWKAAYKDMIRGAMPMFNFLKDMQEKMKGADDDPAKAAEALKTMAEMEDKLKEFEPIEKAMDEFEDIAKATANGKAVMEDKAFEEEVKKEFDIPEDI